MRERTPREVSVRERVSATCNMLHIHVYVPPGTAITKKTLHNLL